ncbi:MAG: DUF6160 family protein [Pseudomonas sp.]|uniref:DUF6160 family protein n=1 Tax=Pseudomonas sp. TaxID=306 RepID=UPI002735C820|nr:DUF6160 family protein [Pseudomonas sp.]MDP3846119.1 DUF6160 family protein [Pseudomonas sp.]
MKTLKQIAFAAAVLAAPFMAQASMTSMDDSALSSVTGQDGISISGNFGGSVGAVKYTDNDANGGSLSLTNIGFTNFTISDAEPLKIDVVTVSITPTGGGAAVATQQLAITMPKMTGTVEVGGIYMGGTYVAATGGATPVAAHNTGAASIGSLAITDLNMAGTVIKVWGH